MVPVMPVNTVVPMPSDKPAFHKTAAFKPVSFTPESFHFIAETFTIPAFAVKLPVTILICHAVASKIIAENGLRLCRNGSGKSYQDKAKK